MTRFTSDRIYLTGSRKTIQRVVFTENNLYFIKWYGNTSRSRSARPVSVLLKSIERRIVMATYLVQIGNINFQNSYKVKSKTEKSAKELAIKRHKELGRSFKDCNVYVKRVV